MSDKPLKVIAGAPNRPLVIGDIEIPCYVLEDETRVLSQRGFQGGLGMSEGGGKGGARKVSSFLESLDNKGIDVKDLMVRANSPIEFRGGSGKTYGYPAVLLVDVCNSILDARDAGFLKSSQAHIASRADLLIRGLATVGIIALVDEATGYQRVRNERALAVIFEKYIAKELQPWTKTFPHEFYDQIYRLKGWDGPYGAKRSPLIGNYTNDIVYNRIAPGLLDELRRINPKIPETGRRKSTHHQRLTPRYGHPKLREHLAGVIALMRAATDWKRFMGNLARAFPIKGENLAFTFILEDDD